MESQSSAPAPEPRNSPTAGVRNSFRLALITQPPPARSADLQIGPRSAWHCPARPTRSAAPAFAPGDVVDNLTWQANMRSLPAGWTKGANSPPARSPSNLTVSWSSKLSGALAPLESADAGGQAHPGRAVE